MYCCVELLVVFSVKILLDSVQKEEKSKKRGVNGACSEWKDKYLDNQETVAILLGLPFFMKRKSPPLFFLGIAVLLLLFAFMSSSFAMEVGIVKTKKFSVWDADKDKQHSDIEAQNRMRDQSGDGDDSDRSSSAQRGGNMPALQERESGASASTTSVDTVSVEDLLKKSDSEVLAQLRNAAVRNALLEKMSQYQVEATAQEIVLVNDWSKRNEVVEENSWVWETLRKHMEDALADNNRSLFLEDVRIAESFHSLVNKKKALATEMLGFSPKTAADFQRGFARALPEWKEAFPEYVKRARKMTYVGTKFFGSVEDCFPFNLEEEEDSEEDSVSAKQEAQLFLTRAQNLIEKARNSSNPALSEEDIRERNAGYDERNAEIDQLIDGVCQTQARSKEFQEHQQFLASLRDDLSRFNRSSDFEGPFNRLKGSMALSLHQEHFSVTREEFMNSPAELSVGESKWRTQKKDYKAYKQKVDEIYAAHLRKDDTLMEAKEREAYCLEALSQLRFDTTPALDSMREKLVVAYQKILSCSFIESTNFNPQTLSPERQKIYQEFLKLGNEALQALGEGRTQAVEAITPLLKQHQTFLIQPSNGLKPLLLRAEAVALRMKIKTEPAMRKIVDEEMASFPWDFKRPYGVNLGVLQNIESQGIAAGTEGGHALSQLNIDGAKAEKLQALKSRLAGEVETPIFSTRPLSQFGGAFLTRSARASELEKLKGPTYRTAVVVEAEKLLEQFRDILPDNRKYDILRGQINNNKDLLIKLLESQIQKIKSASAQSDDAFLKAIEETKLLYPYVEKKIELCKQFVRISPTEWHYEYSDRVDSFWSTMSEATRKVFTQLDQLAASRLLAEQTIIQKNDPYLTHALDEIRGEDERKFQQDLSALTASEPRVQQALQQTQSFCSRITGPALFTVWSASVCGLLWALYLYNTSLSS